MLNAIMLSVVMLSSITLNVFILSVVMLGVVMLNNIMLNIEAQLVCNLKLRPPIKLQKNLKVVLSSIINF